MSNSASASTFIAFLACARLTAQDAPPPTPTSQALAEFETRLDPKQWLPGKFVHPHDACFDAQGNIYVVEWVSSGRVSFLKKVA